MKSTVAATPGALMFIAGLALGYWALSGWGLFGLGDAVTHRIYRNPRPKNPASVDDHDHSGHGGADARAM